jgi:hypothetical protein
MNTDAKRRSGASVDPGHKSVAPREKAGRWSQAEGCSCCDNRKGLAAVMRSRVQCGEAGVPILRQR